MSEKRVVVALTLEELGVARMAIAYAVDHGQLKMWSALRTLRDMERARRVFLTAQETGPQVVALDREGTKC